MSQARGKAKTRVKGKGKFTEGGTAMAEVDSAAMELPAEEIVHTSASATALGGHAPTCVSPPLPHRASLPGESRLIKAIRVSYQEEKRLKWDGVMRTSINGRTFAT